MPIGCLPVAAKRTSSRSVQETTAISAASLLIAPQTKSSCGASRKGRAATALPAEGQAGPDRERRPERLRRPRQPEDEPVARVGERWQEGAASRGVEIEPGVRHRRHLDTAGYREHQGREHVSERRLMGLVAVGVALPEYRQPAGGERLRIAQVGELVR